MVPETSTVDIHCHILPGIDDGPPNMDFSLKMAAAAVRCGSITVAAHPTSGRTTPPTRTRSRAV